jgi:hypothetical protein
MNVNLLGNRVFVDIVRSKLMGLFWSVVGLQFNNWHPYECLEDSGKQRKRFYNEGGRDWSDAAVGLGILRFTQHYQKLGEDGTVCPSEPQIKCILWCFVVYRNYSNPRK